MKSIGAVLAVLGCSFVLCAHSANAAPADLDRSFGGDGSVEVALQPFPVFTVPIGMASDSHGATFVLVETSRPCGSSYCGGFYVAKHGPDGTPDATFQARSTFTLPERIRPAVIAVDQAGRIVVGASGEGGIFLTRLNIDGAIDQSFGVAGRTTLTGSSSISDLLIAPDGSILVAASTASASGSGNTDLLLARFLPNGIPDVGFGTAGVAIADFLPRDASGGLVVSRGEIVVAFRAESQCCRKEVQLRLARFAVNGRLSTVVSPWPPGTRIGDLFGEADRLLAGPDGRLRVVGVGNEGTFAASFLPDGRIERGFGERGVAVVSKLVAGWRGTVAQDAHARLLLGGSTIYRDTGNPLKAVAVTRRASNGRVDRTFAGGRIRPILPPSPHPAWEARVRGVAVQSDGKIVVLVSWLPPCERVCSGGTPIYTLTRFVGGEGHARCRGRKATVEGTRLSETIRGTPRRDVIAALGGADTVLGRSGNDLICGGRGNDRLFGGRGNDRLSGGGGRDFLFGGRDHDRRRQ